MTSVARNIAFEAAARSVADIGRRINARGWCPATSSNFSQRIDEKSVAITISGRDKGMLGIDDIMQVDLEGTPLSAGKPSAETLLHTWLYRRDPAIGAVLHTHAPNPTLLAQLTTESTIQLTGWELLKAFDGITTHEATLMIPVFNNTQNIAQLAADVDRWLDTHPNVRCCGYLIRGHGIYAWGHTMTDCWRHLDAFDHLLSMELERLRISGTSRTTAETSTMAARNQT